MTARPRVMHQSLHVMMWWVIAVSALEFSSADPRCDAPNGVCRRGMSTGNTSASQQACQLESAGMWKKVVVAIR
jgi:hypothetical protein